MGELGEELLVRYAVLQVWRECRNIAFVTRLFDLRDLVKVGFVTLLCLHYRSLQGHLLGSVPAELAHAVRGAGSLLGGRWLRVGDSYGLVDLG